MQGWLCCEAAARGLRSVGSGLVLGTFSLLLLPRSSLLSPLEPAVFSALRRPARLVWWTLAAALDTRASDGGCERASISICFTRSAALSTSPAEAFATGSRSGPDRPESWSILSAIVLVVLRNSASYSANIMVVVAMWWCAAGGAARRAREVKTALGRESLYTPRTQNAV